MNFSKRKMYSDLFHDPMTLYRYSDNFDAVSIAVQRNTNSFQHASYRIRNSPEHVSELLGLDPYILKHCTTNIQRNVAIVRQSIDASPCTILHADPSFLLDKAVVLYCIQRCMELYRSWCPFNVYAHLGSALREDVDVIHATLRYKPDSFSQIPDSIPQYRQIMMDFLQLNPRYITFVPNRYLDDREMMHHYISVNFDCREWFLYLSERLRNDAETVQIFLEHSLLGLKHVGRSARMNRDIIQYALERDCNNFPFVPLRHRSDPVFVNLALHGNGLNLFFCKPPFTTSMIIQAVAQNPAVFKHLSPSLRSDRNLFLQLAKNGLSVDSKFSAGYRDAQNWIQLLYQILGDREHSALKICHFDIATIVRQFLF